MLPESVPNALKQGLLQSQLQPPHAMQPRRPNLRPLPPWYHPAPQSQPTLLLLCQPLGLLPMLLRPHQLPLLFRLPMSALQQKPQACTQVHSPTRLCMQVLHQNIIQHTAPCPKLTFCAHSLKLSVADATASAWSCCCPCNGVVSV